MRRLRPKSVAFARLSLTVAVAASVLSACGTTYTAAVMEDLDARNRKTGVRYYLPQDLMQVTVQIQTRPRSDIEPAAKGPDKWQLVKRPAAVEPLDVNVELMTVADTTHVMVFDTNGVAFGKSDSTISVSEHGLLQSINAKTQGTAGTVVQNVMKLVATAAALPSLGGGAVPKTTTDALTDLATSLESDQPRIAINAVTKMLNPSVADLTASRLASDFALLDTAAVTALKSPPSCTSTSDDEFMATYVTDSKVLRFGFQELPDEVRRRLRDNVCKSLVALTDSETQLRKAQKELAAASSRDTIYVATRKVSLLRTEYHADLASATSAAIELRTEAESLAKQRGYGGAATIETKKYELQLSKFTTSAALKQLRAATIDQLRTDVTKALGDDEQALTFQRALVVLSLDDIQVPTPQADYNKRVPSKCGVAQASKSDACVYHRVARPVRITGWTPEVEKKKDDAGNETESYFLKPISSRVVDVVDDQSVVQAIDLHSSSWTKRDFAIQFTPQGRLVSLRRDYGSAAEDASGAIQQGLSGALTQYQSSLATVKSIRETENALDLMPYQQQLALMTTQNQLQLLPLQQQLALAGAQSALTLQPVNAQLAEATAQLNLIKMQASLEANQAGYAASVQAQLAELERTLVSAQQQLIASQATLGNQPVTLQTAAMLAEIAQIKSEIDLIKIRRELEELKN